MHDTFWRFYTIYLPISDLIVEMKDKRDEIYSSDLLRKFFIFGSIRLLEVSNWMSYAKIVI